MPKTIPKVTQKVETKKHSVLSKLSGAVPREYLKHRILLIILMAVLIFSYVFIFMPRTEFFDTAQGVKSTVQELTTGTRASQQLALKSGTLKSLLIDFDTYYRRNVAEYTVEVFRADGSPITEANGTPVKKVFNADKMTEGIPFGVALPPQKIAEGELLTVKISTDEAQPNRALGIVVKTGGQTPPAKILQNGVETPLSGSLSIQAGYDSFSNNAIIIAIILAIALGLAILFWGKKLHINALVLLIIFGVMFSLVTPIWDTPDEGQHTATAVLLSENQLSAGGGEIPYSYEYIKQNYMKPIPEQTLTGTAQDSVTDFTAWGGGKFFLGFLPQAAGLGVAKLFGLDMAGYFYIGRIFNAIAYAIMAFFAIRYIKKFKLYFAVLAMLPMSLMIAGSYNPDGITYGLGLLLISYFTNMYFDKEKLIGWREMLVFGVLAVLLIMNKYTLAALCILPMIIPAVRFKNRSTKWLLSVAIVAACAMGALGLIMWQNSGSGDTSSLTATNTFGASVSGQLSWILQNPGAAVSVYSKTIMGNLGNDVLQLFSLGQLTYDVYSIFSLIYFAFLAVVGFGYTRYEYSSEIAQSSMKVSLVSRAFILLVIFGSILMTYMALHLTWTPVGADTILGVQGRYYVPLLALLPFIGQNTWPIVEKDAYERSRLNILFVAASIAAITLLTTLLKYY